MENENENETDSTDVKKPREKTSEDINEENAETENNLKKTVNPKIKKDENDELETKIKILLGKLDENIKDTQTREETDNKTEAKTQNKHKEYLSKQDKNQLIYGMVIITLVVAGIYIYMTYFDKKLIK